MLCRQLFCPGVYPVLGAEHWAIEQRRAVSKNDLSREERVCIALGRKSKFPSKVCDGRNLAALSPASCWYYASPGISIPATLAFVPSPVLWCNFPTSGSLSTALPLPGRCLPLLSLPTSCFSPIINCSRNYSLCFLNGAIPPSSALLCTSEAPIPGSVLYQGHLIHALPTKRDWGHEVMGRDRAIHVHCCNSRAYHHAWLTVDTQ